MLTSTKNIDNHFVKILVHGAAGAGKTRLSATINKPLIISAEAGLLSLRDYDIPVFKVENFAGAFTQAFEEAQKDDYEWIVLDSISEIAEVCLNANKAANKDGRAAYGDMNDMMSELIRKYRDLSKNVYMTAKQARVKDDVTGQTFFGPSMPGAKLTGDLPYFFDEVFALHTWKDEDGNIGRTLQTSRDHQYEAKDRSGVLNMYEDPDLGAIRNKILGINETKAIAQ